MKPFDLEQFMRDVHETHIQKGFWEKPHKTPLECLALVTAEVAEAMEEVRLDPPRPPIYQVQGLGTDENGIYYAEMRTPEDPDWRDELKTEGLAVELADVVLRILDFCEYHKLPLIQAMQLKHEFNKSRPYRHGKKL